MKKVAALYMCTGQYLKLWPEFLASAEKYLLKQCEVHYFVFTDADHLEGEESNSRVHRIFQKPQPWPYTTLKRFEIFLQIEDELKKFDYIYFFKLRDQSPHHRRNVFAASGKAREDGIRSSPVFLHLV